MKCLSLLLLLVNSCIFVFAQSVPAYVPTDSLQGWYPFNGNANNEYGTGKNGAVVGPTSTSDRFGTANAAYHFNGMADHIVIDTAFFNVGWSNFTVSLWFNSDSLDNPYNSNNNQEMFNTIPHNGFGLGANWGHTGKYALYGGQNPAIASWNILAGAVSSTPFHSHVWNHMVVVKQNDTSYYLYYNGHLDSSYHRSLLASNYFCKMFLGNIDSVMGTEGFWGSLDDYGIWNRALAACEVRRLYTSSSYTYLLTQPVNDTSAVLSTVHFSITDTGTGNTYQWQVNSGSGFSNIAGTSPYSGVTTPTLTITGITAALNMNQYRCVVSGAQPCVDTSSSARLVITSLGLTQPHREKLSIVPNPTADMVTVLGVENVNIEVYNAVGQLLINEKQTHHISLAELANGIYLIRVSDENGHPLLHSKVIKY